MPVSPMQFRVASQSQSKLKSTKMYYATKPNRTQANCVNDRIERKCGRYPTKVLLIAILILTLVSTSPPPNREEGVRGGAALNVGVAGCHSNSPRGDLTISGLPPGAQNVLNSQQHYSTMLPGGVQTIHATYKIYFTKMPKMSRM